MNPELARTELPPRILWSQWPGSLEHLDPSTLLGQPSTPTGRTAPSPTCVTGDQGVCLWWTSTHEQVNSRTGGGISGLSTLSRQLTSPEGEGLPPTVPWPKASTLLLLLHPRGTQLPFPDSSASPPVSEPTPGQAVASGSCSGSRLVCDEVCSFFSVLFLAPWTDANISLIASLPALPSACLRCSV